MKTKFNRMGLIGLFSVCLLILGAVFANTTITGDVFESIGATTGSIAYVSFSSEGNVGSGAIIFGHETKTGYFNLTLFEDSITCHEQLFGYYENPFRGDYRIWPLNSETDDFEGLSMVGGLFTNCTGEGKDLDPYAVFGYIDYTYIEEESLNIETGYKIRVGISGLGTETPSFANNLILTGGGDESDLSASGWILDSVANIGIVYPYESGNFSETRELFIWDSETETGYINCEWTGPTSGEIVTGGSTIFTLSCTGSDEITGTITSSNITIFPTRNDGSVNVNDYTDLNEIVVTFTAGAETGSVRLRLQSGAICLSGKDICNNNFRSPRLVITGADIPGGDEPLTQSGNAPTIEITNQPSTQWSQHKTITATSSNYSGFEYVVSENTCTSSTVFSSPSTYNAGDSIVLSDESYNGKFLCFRAWNSYGTGYIGSNEITKIDTTNPNCTWLIPSNSEMHVGEFGSITLTCVDTGAGIQNTNLNESDITHSDKLEITNVTSDSIQNGRKYIVEYKAISTGSTNFTIPANKINDSAGNKNNTESSLMITVIGADNPGHGSATCENLLQFIETPLSTWTQADAVEIERLCGSTGGWWLAMNNHANGSTVEPLDYSGVENNHFILNVVDQSLNDWYVCAFAQTGERIQTICSNYPFKVDPFNPEVNLINPHNGTTFELGDYITLSRSGSDIISGISGYVLEITKPNYETVTKHFNANTTSTGIVANLSGRWDWSVRAYDRAGRSSIKTQYFYIEYSGGNDNPGGDEPGTQSGEISTGFYLISPRLFESISLGNDVTFYRNPGSENSGYRLKVERIGGDIIYSGFTNSSSIILTSGYFTTGAYSRSVKDFASDTLESIPLFFVIDTDEPADLKVDQFEFNGINNADIDEYYTSDSIIIDGLDNGGYTYAYLKDSIGAFYLNGDFIGTGGFVTNGDRIHIELKSSHEYNTTVSTTLIVGTGSDLVSGDFKVTTKRGVNGWNDDSLTPLQRLWGAIFVDSLVEMYQDNPEKLATFLSTFMQLLQDKSDYYAQEILNTQLSGDNELANEYRTYKNAVDFLYTIVRYRYDNLEVEDRTVYIAPNGKQYLVEYDENRMAYTSPDFTRPKYFPTRELFTNHIDMNNPAVGKWGIVGNVITTHNGKVYTIYETNGKWTSSNFKAAKYFDTKEDIINHILANNPASNWNHTVDPDFEPVVYTAPNGKVYKIFKTSSKGNNPNMYSSYNFVNAKYFTSLEAAKKFINQNNKK